MHRAQEQVRDFHRAMDLKRPDRPVQVVDQEDLKLRLNLILEETVEVAWACGLDVEINTFGARDFEPQAVIMSNDMDILDLVDGLCDLLYVTYGMAVALGIDLDPFFEEVQRANMEKAGGPKREDGKQLKPEGWRPPDHLKVWREVYNQSPR